MQFETKSSKVIRHKILNGVRTIKSASTQFGHNLQMYNQPPAEDITILEFETIAHERLKALKALEDIKSRFPWHSDQLKQAVHKEIGLIMPIVCKTMRDADREVARHRDLIGHYILRLAFCRSPETTKWLITQEVDLFKFRFMNENRDSIEDFLRHNNFDNLERVEIAERDALSEDLSAACDMSETQISVTDFWKIHFTHALELIRRRKVLLKGGMAYVAFKDLVVIVSGILRANMSGAMARAVKHLAMVDEENRLLPRLARIANNAYQGKNYSGEENPDTITRHMIDELANSFPLCMRSMHRRLRTDHHLKHGARRQYGLFLKAIGLPMDEAIAMMREEFTKKMDADKFDKQYAYNVRHMYGKEGKRTSYAALPCAAIILHSAPAAGDCHGCPYKHSEPQMLSQRLEREGVNKTAIQEIVNLSGEHRYDRACTRFFEEMHQMDSGALGELITHPNQFYELSREVLDGKRSKENHYTQQSQTIKKEEIVDAVTKIDDDFDEDF